MAKKVLLESADVAETSAEQVTEAIAEVVVSAPVKNLPQTMGELDWFTAPPAGGGREAWLNENSDFKAENELGTFWFRVQPDRQAFSCNVDLACGIKLSDLYVKKTPGGFYWALGDQASFKSFEDGTEFRTENYLQKRLVPATADGSKPEREVPAILWNVSAFIRDVLIPMGAEARKL